MGAIDERLGEIDLPAVPKVLSESSEHPLEDPVLDPFLESAVAGRGRGIAPGEVSPRRAGSEHPQHAIHDISRVTPRPTALWRSPSSLTAWEAPLDLVPLLVGEVHPDVRSWIDRPREFSSAASEKRSNFAHLARGLWDAL